jgi:MFS family permease
MSNRSFASWIVDRPGPAVLVTGLLGLLPLLGLGFAFFLPGAVPALIVLMRGPRAGILVAAGAVMLLALAVWFVGRPLPVGLIYAAWVLGPPLALAVLFQRTGSLSMSLQVAVLAGVVLVLLLHLALGDPEQFWAPRVRDLATEMQRRGLPMDFEQDQFVETLARTLWGWVTVLTVLLAMCALFLARWWESRNEQPGRFGAEFQQLRLGIALGSVAAVAIVASLVSDQPLVDDLARLFLGALMMVGLAAAHRFKAMGRLGGVWLWLIYTLLVLAAPIMVAVLAGWGFVDNWLRSRQSARAEA